MSETNEAFADVKKEGDDPFAQLNRETETPAESQPEKKEGEVKPDQGVNTDNEDEPFNKRWEARANNLREEINAEWQGKFDSYQKELETKIPPVTDTKSDIPDWFRGMFGEDQTAWDKYSEYDKGRRDEIKYELAEEQQSQKTQEQEEVKYWDKWVADEVTKLQSTNQFDRNELMKVMLDYRPTDEAGNFDFQAGLRILETIKPNESNPEKSNARKQVADTINKSTSGGAKVKDYMTTAEARSKTWNQL